MKTELFFLGIIITQLLKAQDVWTPIANCPAPPSIGRTGELSFSAGGKGYIGFGLEVCINPSCAFLNDLWEYDPSNDSWSQKANCPGPAREWGVAFGIGNKGYVCSGRDNWTVFLSDLWEYDPLSNSWTQKTSLPAGGRYRAVGFSIGNKGYVGTGNDAVPNNFQDFWEYDPVLDSWTQKTNFAGGSRELATGFAIGNKGYVGLGLNGATDFWEYDPSLDTWIQKANFPSPNYPYGAWFSIANKGYFGTGSTGNTGSVDFWEFDPVADTWTPRANFPQQRRLCIGFSIGNEGYLGLGEWWGTYQPSLWKYSPLVTDIANEETSNSVSVFPNPSSGIFNLQSEQEITQLEIYNAISEKIYEPEINANNTEIDLTSYPAGVYFIRIKTGSKVLIQKLVIQK